MALPNCPVDLLNIFAAGLLMKAVYILGDDAFQPAGFLHFCQLQVGGVRFCAPCVQILSEVIEEDFGLISEALVAEQVLGLVASEGFDPLFVEAVFASEIRDAAFRGDACAAEEHDVFRLKQDVAKSVVLLLLTEAVVVTVFLAL